MKIRGNTVGTPIKPEKNLVKATDLNPEEKAQARENIGAVSTDTVARVEARLNEVVAMRGDSNEGIHELDSNNDFSAIVTTNGIDAVLVVNFPSMVYLKDTLYKIAAIPDHLLPLYGNQLYSDDGNSNLYIEDGILKMWYRGASLSIAAYSHRYPYSLKTPFIPELADMRVSANGTVYGSAGAAMRAIDTAVGAVVLYTEQTLTPEQQAQARENVGVAGTCGTGEGSMITEGWTYASGSNDAEVDKRYNEAIGDSSIASGMGAIAYSRASKSLGYRTQTGYPPSAEYVEARTRWVDKDGNTVEKDSENAVSSVVEVFVKEDASGNPIYPDQNNSQAAVAIGSDTVAVENNAFAGGFKSQAIGKNAIALGNGAIAKGDGAVSIGFGTKAIKESQWVAGKWNVEDDTADFIVGCGTGDTSRKNALTISKDTGKVNILTDMATKNVTATSLQVNGTANVSSNTKLNGELQVGNTYPFKVNGNGSVSAGNQSETAAAYSFAFGTWDSSTQTPTKAAGQGSFACGQASQALALASFSAGRFTKANHSCGIALGLNTTTGRDAQTVVGQYNTVKDNALFVVGNGTSVKPSNALEVDTAGNTTIAGQLKFGSIDKVSAEKVRNIRGAFEAPDETTPGDFDGQICMQTDGISANVYIWSEGIRKWIKLC